MFGGRMTNSIRKIGGFLRKYLEGNVILTTARCCLNYVMLKTLVKATN